MPHRASAIRSALAPGARLSFVSGNFNIVHPGHLRLLKFAADTADVLVVGLNPDTAPGVSIPASMRLEGVRALAMVHHAEIVGDIPAFIAALRPEVIVKGKEFEARANPEAEAARAYGGRLIFSSGDIQFAATDLLRHELPPLPLLRDDGGFRRRHGIGEARLRAVLDRMSTLRVAVIGDTIVDDYVTCDPLGMSQEDPTIVVSPIETRTFVGGAAIVAAHARSLGAAAHFVTVLGADDTADHVRAHLAGLDVTLHAVTDDTRPTTRKRRYRALGKTLLRVNHLRQHDIDRHLCDAMLDAVEAVLPATDLLMFADFNYGCLPQHLVEAIRDLARRHGVAMTADSQASSQMSDISRFRGMHLITPTEREARLALRDTASGLAVLGARLRAAAEADNVLMTLGEDGLMVHAGDDGGGDVTDRLPALNGAPQDVAGAGDSLFTAASMALRAGADIWLAAYLGSVAAALQVARIGNTPLKAEDILAEIGASPALAEP